MSNTGKADFSKVTSSVETTEDVVPKADFSQVTSSVGSSKELPDRTHTVARGDNLSKISKTYYGSSNHWRSIFDANRDQLDNPDLIQPGQVLKIPHLDTDNT